MKTILHALAVLGSVMTLDGMAQAPAAAAPLEVARFTPAGKLQKPADMTSWIFVGTSLGMGYNPGSFNAANPGQFQVVLMEPTAYRHFEKHRSYAPGSMFLLFFQAEDKYTRVVTADSCGHIRTPLKELIVALDSEAFWQVHRSVIVRASAIRTVEKAEDGKLHLTVRGHSETLP